MSKKPIIFNTEMVKAILDGRKTQTRRIIKNNKKAGIIENGYFYRDKISYNASSNLTDFGKQKIIELCSQYQVGDILYVKEPCKIMTLKGCHTDKSLILVYKYRNDITNTEYEIKLPDRFYGKDNAVPDWVSWFGKTIIPSGSIKEMARIFLKVTNVRVERLQDITFEDVTKEGLPFDVKIDIEDIEHKAKLRTSVFTVEMEMFEWWTSIWNSTEKDGYKWEDNPYVFVYEFERVENDKKSN